MKEGKYYEQTMIIVGVVGLITTLATNKLFEKLNNKTKEKEEEHLRL